MAKPVKRRRWRKKRTGFGAAVDFLREYEQKKTGTARGSVARSTMPLVQAGQGEPFKHCLCSAFLLPEMLNTELRNRWQRLRSAAGGGKSEQGLAQARDFLNSFSPSRPILRPKLSDILRHLLEIGIKKGPCGSGVYEKGAAWVGAPFVVNCSINGKLINGCHFISRP